MNAYPDSHYQIHGGLELLNDVPPPRNLIYDDRALPQVLSDLCNENARLWETITYLRGVVGQLQADVADLLKWKRMSEGDHR
jgi:hypothetical protein